MRSSLLLLPLCLAPGLALAGFSVSPVKIDRAVTPTDNVLELIVSNPGEHPLNLELSAVPLVHDERGAPKEGPDSYRYDISKNIHFDTPSLVLPARKWKRLRARIDVPNRAGGGYAMIYVRGIEADV